jgi:hypothetical protein
MLVAVSRQCVFEPESITDAGAAMTPLVGTNARIALQSIQDVAAALNYEDVDNYNEACLHDTDEVQKRLDAL